MNSFFDTAKFYGTKALDKAEEVIDTGTDKVKTMKKQSDVRDVYREIGEYVFENRENFPDDPMLEEKFAKADALLAEINASKNPKQE